MAEVMIPFREDEHWQYRYLFSPSTNDCKSNLWDSQDVVASCKSTSTRTRIICNGREKGSQSGKTEYRQRSLNQIETVDYSIESNREKSFQMSPIILLRIKTLLVLSGFYFTMDGDKVKCFQCGLELSDWSKTHDTPKKRHAAESPLCTFIKSGRSSPNLLQTDDASEVSHHDVRKKKIKAYRKSLGDMSLAANRKKTFTNWPESLADKLKVDDIVHGGFYYAKEENTIVCPQCGTKKNVNELRSMLTPFECHTSWSPNCKFVKDNEKQSTKKDSVDETPKPSVKRWAWMKDDAVMALLDLGTIEKTKIKQAAFSLKKDMGDKMMDAEMLMEEIHRRDDLGDNYGQKDTPDDNEPEVLVNLRLKNKELRKIAYCYLCKKAVSDLLMLPCKHLVSCELCGESVDECPKCDSHILATVKTYYG